MVTLAAPLGLHPRAMCSHPHAPLHCPQICRSARQLLQHALELLKGNAAGCRCHLDPMVDALLASLFGLALISHFLMVYGHCPYPGGWVLNACVGCLRLLECALLAYGQCPRLGTAYTVYCALLS